VTVVKKRQPCTVIKALVDLPAGEPIIGRLKLTQVVPAAASFILVDIVYFRVTDIISIHGTEKCLCLASRNYLVRQLKNTEAGRFS